MGYEKNKRDRSKGQFAAFPFVILDHPDFKALSGNAAKLLLQAVRQYNGRNNGKICFVWSQMKELGWKSKTTLTAAKKQLIDKKFLVVTKYGGFVEGKGVPQFYALTWLKIDEIHGFNMDIEPTKKPIRCFSHKLISFA